MSVNGPAGRKGSATSYHALDDDGGSGLAPSASFALQPAGSRVHSQSIGGEVRAKLALFSTRMQYDSCVHFACARRSNAQLLIGGWLICRCCCLVGLVV